MLIFFSVKSPACRWRFLGHRDRCLSPAERAAGLQKLGFSGGPEELADKLSGRIEGVKHLPGEGRSNAPGVERKIPPGPDFARDAANPWAWLSHCRPRPPVPAAAGPSSQDLCFAEGVGRR